MNFNFDIVMILALFTIGAVLVFAIFSGLRAKKAQDHHEDAAVAERQRHEDPAVPVDGTPGKIDPTASPHRVGTVSGSDQPLDPDLVAPNDSGRSWTKDRGNNPPTPMPPRN